MKKISLFMIFVFAVSLFILSSCSKEEKKWSIRIEQTPNLSTVSRSDYSYIDFQAFVKDDHGNPVAAEDLTVFNKVDWEYVTSPSRPLSSNVIGTIGNDKARISLDKPAYLPSNTEVTIIAKMFFKDASTSKTVKIVN
jgi:hypothetical protein